jgi:hypothetical protein
MKQEIQELSVNDVKIVNDMIMDIAGGGMQKSEMIIIVRHGRRWRKRDEYFME